MKRQRETTQPRKHPPPPTSTTSSTPSNDSDPNKVNVILTPHTLRLLKLIQDGSHEHASMAALQLTTITAQSSPLVLWDVLGRLQTFLVHEQWQTRQNAGQAMQGVARHLPLAARQQFLQAETKEGNFLWLTLNDFQLALHSIVQQGRLLWSHSEGQLEQREEEILQQMDQKQLKGDTTSSSSNQQEDFVQRRIQWQRRVLAQRIGLSGLLQATGNLPDSFLSDTITAEDLKPVVSTDIKRTAKRQRKGAKSEVESKESQQAETVRALLVLEMKREQESPKGVAISHDNPQKLLATELLYRVFDPVWHVRHGALMGMLSLLKAWHGSAKSVEKFGAWPHDILVRCLCILVLDRFGDYSGTTTMGAQEGSESGSVVAPVRETAGQLLSMVWHFAPTSIRGEALDLLCRLAKGEAAIKRMDGQQEDRSLDWEIRHGSLIALKYIVAVQCASSTHDDAVDAEIPKVAIHRLGDDSDDVKSVAAQILCTVLASPGDQQWRQDAFDQACQALMQTRNVSSSILDLLTLCSDLLHHMVTLPSKTNIATGTGATILEIFTNYLDHDLASVRLAALRSITNCLKPLLEDKGNELADDKLSQALDKVQIKIFDTFFQDVSQEGVSKSSGDTEQRKRLEPQDTFLSCRNSAWSSLTQLRKQRKHTEDQAHSMASLFPSLVIKYFGVSNTGNKNNGCQQPKSRGECDRLAYLIDAADALADIFVQNFGIDAKVPLPGSLHVLEFSIKTFLHSPWADQFEASCLLFRALNKKVARHSSGVNSALQAILTSCQLSVYQVLDLGDSDLAPACMAAGQSKADKELLNDPDLLRMRDSSFLNGLEMAVKGKQGGKLEDGVCAVKELLKEAISAKVGLHRIFATEMRSVATTINAMRGLAITAGAIIAGNLAESPLKRATPVIRPLMTSLKNEKDQARRSLSCNFMAELLAAMYARDSNRNQLPTSPFSKAREKVLGNVCGAICSSSSDDSGGSSPVVSFRLAAQLFLQAISKQISTMEALSPIWQRLSPLFQVAGKPDGANISPSLILLYVVSENLETECDMATNTICRFTSELAFLACCADDERVRANSSKILHMWCSGYTKTALPQVIPGIMKYLEDKTNDAHRLAACTLLLDIVQAVGLELCPFVRTLLRLVMSLMSDPLPACAKKANGIFACLVRVAPLVPSDATTSTRGAGGSYDEASVVDHLIHGRPLPPYSLPSKVETALNKAGISLRRYQMEGVTWLRFLQGVNLNGALCDSMGLGKTLQALIGVAIAHVDGVRKSAEERPKSLVVCPSSVVGHWEAEVAKFFPDEIIFKSLAFIGSSKDREALWKQKFQSSNIVVTSYSVLRTDIEILSKPFWRFCILDEGHLIRNPKTATAKAARRIRSDHSLILSGTPVQNKVQEIFAAFDFLMPNFLGSPASFAKEFSNPITKCHLPGATAEQINVGIEKLKVLHQQVLPFILRREKEDVLKELPPKTISTIPCEMSSRQRKTYDKFLATEEAKRSIEELKVALQKAATDTSEASKENGLNVGSEALKTLLFLRLLCTHPLLVEGNKAAGTSSIGAYDVDMSGKFVALAELLRACGIHEDQVTGADNDTSVLYCNADEEDDRLSESADDVEELLGPVDHVCVDDQQSTATPSKALVFAQFTQSLDVLEELLIKRHMPSVNYLRLDGRVPPTRRSALVDAFNNDPSIKLMLLTARVGSLGLNLTGADTVIFLENDFNPFVDMQAADRAHRIGQAKTVNVYRLVTKDTIEERILSIQEKKLAMSKAIVNTENSTLFSMGTDRLLDIFTCRTDSQSGGGEADGETGYNLDALVDNYKDEYSALSLQGFIEALKN